MWTGLYPGKPEDAVPIGHITNGVHVPSWLAPQMCRLYDRHLGVGWQSNSGAARTWEEIENVDDGELWETHLSLKSQLLRLCAPPRAGAGGAPRRAPETLQAGQGALARCADHRLRAPLCHLQARQPVLADMERLAAMVNDPKRPVQFVFAGKAHPHDEPGKRVLQQIAQMMRDSEFADKFVFIEDYDINVGRTWCRAWMCG
jgi:glycogen phosphorylase